MRSTPRAGMSESDINDWKALMLYNTAPLPMRKYVGELPSTAAATRRSVGLSAPAGSSG